ncbi:MFS transporter [Actinomadura madurae]|uniref:MFS transporter n=1 Tax=Actinomadura madurae TaxID=1993 RepID=UPI0020D20240|nr:MFS transporter [Actinomadura madurae]MCP9952052.1 MFS transporter [Actinomadura madurae]MCP9968814.1 MFS transporter [Actinomadura madurae]MCP9981290.1 MFS transporter [Actinomadura madurae]MCQ0007203.1 MFS transporter [Actinomadura madurae]
MIGRSAALPLHLTSATMLRVSAEGVATALVLTVEARTGNAATAGYLQTAMTLPYVLSGPVIGDALDRVGRPRRVAVALAACYAVATAALLLTAGRSPLALALLIAAVIGCTEPIVVALTSLLPRFVPAGRLSRAYGLEASSYNLAGIAGPGLAAGLAALAGGEYAGIAVVAVGLLGLLTLPLLPFPGPSAGTAGALSAEPTAATGAAAVGAKAGPRAAGTLSVITGGLVVLAGGRVLRALTVATTLAWMGFGGVAVTAVLLAEHIGGPPSAGGRLLVAMAVGSLIGSLASSRWLTPKHAEPVMIAGLVAFGASLAALAVTPSLPWATAAFVAAGVSEGPVFAATLMLRQRESPPDRLGQVNTTGGSLKIGASALGAALTAAFADAVGPIGLVLGIAAFQFAGALAGLLLLRVPASEKPAEDDP